MESAPEITIIICTLAQAERASALRQAIHSIVSQEGVDAVPLVVVNGSKYSPALRQELEATLGNRCIYLPEGNLGCAHRAGVDAVRTDLYGFLDDDDELLPHGLAHLTAALRNDLSLDYVVGNGIVDRFEGDKHAFPPDPDQVARLNSDLPAALMHANWLASCGGLYRADRITSALFDGTVRQFEWTYYAFRLSTERKGMLIPQATYQVHDTPVSTSKRPEHQIEYVNFLRLMHSLSRRSRPDLVRAIRAREASAYNAAAMTFLQERAFRKALAFQWRGLLTPGGLTYLPALGRIVLALISRGGIRTGPRGGDQI